MTPIICAKPSLPKARSPSSPTTRHGRSNIRSTSTSMPSVISWSAASPSSSNFAASQPASKRPPEITLPSSLLQPSSCGCDKCPHYLEGICQNHVRLQATRSRRTWRLAGPLTVRQLVGEARVTVSAKDFRRTLSGIRLKSVLAPQTKTGRYLRYGGQCRRQRGGRALLETAATFEDANTAERHRFGEWLCEAFVH